MVWMSSPGGQSLWHFCFHMTPHHVGQMVSSHPLPEDQPLKLTAANKMIKWNDQHKSETVVNRIIFGEHPPIVGNRTIIKHVRNRKQLTHTNTVDIRNNKGLRVRKRFGKYVFCLFFFFWGGRICSSASFPCYFQPLELKAAIQVHLQHFGVPPFHSIVFATFWCSHFSCCMVFCD